MIGYLFLGLLVLVGVMAALRGLAATDPRLLSRALKILGIVLAVGGFLVLLLRGGAGVVMMLASLLVPLYLRWQRSRLRWRPAGGPATGQLSEVETRYLRMRLHHDTGTLEGVVLAGAARGQSLASLPLKALLRLLAECRAEDPDSVSLLEAYLDRTHGAVWREAAAEAGSDDRPSPAAGTMTVADAYALLGLAEGASAEQIKDAHRRLMQRNHPDHGGSDYLAARINEARDLLLGRH